MSILTLSGEGIIITFITLDEIQFNVNSNKYESVSQFLHDIDLLVSNVKVRIAACSDSATCSH